MKHTKSILTILFVALLVSFSTSCKKDKTTANPNIEFHTVNNTFKSGI